MTRLRSGLLILSVTVSLLVATVITAHLGRALWSAIRADTSTLYDGLSEPARGNYRHMSRAAVESLLSATWRPGWTYEPWTGFRERPRTSEFVNVDDAGLRSNHRQDHPLSRLEGAVWLLGGSTTFGYGVADDETIPAQLEQLLGRPVVNFGRGYFYSAQENLLLQRYLGAGHRPSEVWFLDGINERCELRVYEHAMSVLFNKAQDADRWDYLELVRPLSALMTGIVGRRAADADATRQAEETRDLGPCTRFGRSTSLTVVVANQLLERAALCRAYGIRCRTFVQPFPAVHVPHRGPELTAWERRVLQTLYERI